MNRIRAGLLATLPFASLCFAGAALADEVPTTLLVLADGAAAVSKRCDVVQAEMKSSKAALEGQTGPSTISRDFAAYDALNALGQGAFAQFNLVTESHPDKGVRDAAILCVQAITAINTDISLSRAIYARLAAIPTSGLDSKTGYTLGKLLDTYRRAGVGLDDATRASVAALINEIGEISLKFAANIRDDTGDIPLDPAELVGMPADFLAARKPADDGKIHLTYDYPDIFPVRDFAPLRSTRQKVVTGMSNRAWPANEQVLQSLLEKRYALAKLLGYPDYATLITSDKMIGSPHRVERFLDDINAAVRPGADMYFAELSAFAKAEDPTIQRLERWDGSYFGNKLKKQKYDVDAAEVRQYFSYDKAQAGIFKLMHDLFGADIRPWAGASWSEDVSGWSLYDGDRLVGHFYLDMFPREGKYNHAATFPIQHGIAGKQVPIGALLCNFPKAGAMDHDDVVTFLHEFGHLIHWLYAGNQAYSLQNMDSLQWDFIETPSQLLEEWAWDYDTLKTFASNDKGQPIPAALVDRMNAGRRFSEAATARSDIGGSAVSLNFYNRKPEFDLKQMFDAQIERYSPYPNVQGTHNYASFSHLDGYSAIYYTYIWSRAIAIDLFTTFKQQGVRDQGVAKRYRMQILEAGATADAGALIKDFLGREWTLDAFREQLMQD